MSAKEVKKLWDAGPHVMIGPEDYLIWHVRNVTEKDKVLDPELKMPSWYFHEPIFFLRANVAYDLYYFLLYRANTIGGGLGKTDAEFEKNVKAGKAETDRLPIDEFALSDYKLLLVHSIKQLNMQIKAIDPTFKCDSETDDIPAAWWFYRHRLPGWMHVPEHDVQKITKIMISCPPHMFSMRPVRTITALEAINIAGVLL